MKKTALFTLALLAIASCKPQYQKVIEEHLEKVMKDPRSYECVKMDSPQLLTPMAMFLGEYNKRAKQGECSYDTLNSALASAKEYFISQGINPYDTLRWEVRHTYRGTNSYGATIQSEIVWFLDREMTKVIGERE